ncbi:MAG: hypothetical protein O3A95_07970 [Planctomycetota bacterium]|nr:hypothetical protein [Planctomycetota bacterium]MDA1114218.1 hypothetical protein [Planctomycetota bacterium]
MGADLAPFSDHDGDGLGDYLVGAQGSAFLISGSVVCRADDVDGDGVEDILIDAPHASSGGKVALPAPSAVKLAKVLIGADMLTEPNGVTVGPAPVRE